MLLQVAEAFLNSQAEPFNAFLFYGNDGSVFF